MKINTNIQALNAYRNLNSNQFHTSKNLEKLSSGMRINRAADDAAGLAISEKMRAQIRGLKMAERNSMDGISMIQTAEGALTEVHAMLQRMRELAVQAANDTNTDTDRKEIQKEINQLTSEVNRIGNATEFNTKKLLNGGATKIAPVVEKEGTAISTGKLVVNELVASELIVQEVTGFNIDKSSDAETDPPTPGEYSFTLPIDIASGDTLKIGDVTFTFGDGTDGTVEIAAGPAQTANNLRSVINNSNDLNFNATHNGAELTLTEKAATGNDLSTPVLTKNSLSTPGQYSVTVEEMFARGEKVTIAGVSLTAVSGGANSANGEFNVGNTKEEQAHNIKTVLENHPTLSSKFDVSVTNNIISLKEKSPSGDALAVFNTGNATGTVFFDHQVRSVEAQAPVWETGAITRPGAGTLTFRGVTVTVSQSDNLDAIRNALASSALHPDFSFEVSGSGIKITGPTTDAGSLNDLRIHAGGNLIIENNADDNSQLDTPGVTAAAAKYVFDITSTFKENETVSIGGFTFKGVSGTANATNQEFSVDGSASNQAESLRNAIASNPTLSARYNVTLSGSKITVEEKVAGSEKADNVAALTHPSTALTQAIPGQFSFKIERSIVGQSFTIDGQEIKVVNDSVAFNDDVNNGRAMRYDDNLVQQAANLREAINRNAALNERYLVTGTGENIILTQRSGQESAELPRVMLGNTGTGDTFRSQLQIGPNQGQTLTFELNDMRAPELGLSTTDPRAVIRDNNGDVIQGAAWNVIREVSNGMSENPVEYSLDITSHEKATAAISVIDAAIERVNAQRASLGAFQNRLEHTINNLQVTHENLTASESRIRDADMALEMTQFTKNNILNQSATAMLAQANQLPQGVLQLLQ